jgi:hypothetical protein
MDNKLKCGHNDAVKMGRCTHCGAPAGGYYALTEEFSPPARLVRYGEVSREELDEVELLDRKGRGRMVHRRRRVRAVVADAITEEVMTMAGEGRLVPVVRWAIVKVVETTSWEGDEDPQQEVWYSIVIGPQYRPDDEEELRKGARFFLS